MTSLFSRAKSFSETAIHAPPPPQLEVVLTIELTIPGKLVRISTVEWDGQGDFYSVFENFTNWFEQTDGKTYAFLLEQERYTVIRNNVLCYTISTNQKG